jgi:hypothetical protein
MLYQVLYCFRVFDAFSFVSLLKKIQFSCFFPTIREKVPFCYLVLWVGSLFCLGGVGCLFILLAVSIVYGGFIVFTSFSFAPCGTGY